MNNPRAGIVFQVETGRILEILASEIYDSPHALLRENVQNAYDAVLMRASASRFTLDEARIDVVVTPTRVSVRDNGIGMTETVLRENFWKAGSSGKRTEAALKAGVVGTFGIGAMANFGVASSVVVQTRADGQDTVLRTSAYRDKLSIQEECIELVEVQASFDVGSLVEVELDAAHSLDVGTAVQYLQSYVRHLPVDVICNGDRVSREPWGPPSFEGEAVPFGTGRVEDDQFTFDFELTAHQQGTRVVVRLDNLGWAGVGEGQGVLVQQAPPLMALRNHFGLAPIPVTSHYSFGGYINAPFLQPTAGREALSRESIQRVAALVSRIEHEVSSRLATLSQADRNAAFLQHATSGPIEWAAKVTVRVSPLDDRLPLDSVGDRAKWYYAGSDSTIIRMYGTAESPLVVLDASNPRRKLQTRYIAERLGLQPVPDRPSVKKEYSGSELRYAEASFLIRATSVLIEEYFVGDAEIVLADLTHGVQVLVDASGDPTLRIYLSRTHPHLGAVVESYSAAGEAFGALVRDFVRNQIYGAISAHVPSATRQGADALIAQVQRNRELYRYDEQDLGDIDPLLADLLSGHTTVGEVLRRAGRRARPQTQSVTAGQVGSLEAEVPDVVHDELAAPSSLEARPPILRGELDTPMKILTSETEHPSLNGFRMLLGLSERLSRRERPFFDAPHQTRIMWAQHRIVYVFTHAAGELSLYYDIEMPGPLAVSGQGGIHLPTTTLITKRRIFVPVPDDLRASFDPTDGERRFHVRFDTVLSGSAPSGTVHT